MRWRGERGLAPVVREVVDADRRAERELLPRRDEPCAHPVHDALYDVLTHGNHTVTVFLVGDDSAEGHGAVLTQRHELTTEAEKLGLGY